MSQSHAGKSDRLVPTRRDAVVFRGKSLLLQIRRAFSDIFGSSVRRFSKTSEFAGQSVIAESQTPLWTEIEPQERFLVAGKIQNLRRAAASLDGVEIRAGAIFSFWKHIGRTTRLRGYVAGRELREGCIIPNIGGGLCQLSNALYDAALKSNFEILERHAHTQTIVGSLAEQNRDATVFWNYVDLRFRSPKPFRIDAKLDSANLTVQFRGEKLAMPSLHQISRRPVLTATPNSCASCEVGDCHRVIDKAEHENFGRTAFLVDDVWPEFDEYIRANRTMADILFMPVDGTQFRRANYAWTTAGFGRVEQSRFITAVRSVSSRKLTAQGAARQQNLLATYRSLAQSYARRLRYDTLHVVVQQNLLPFLWETGQLGGRTFDVLMTALPMAHLQKRLDYAKSLHPESGTLGDFRADQKLVESETEALKNARRIITPHSDIASLFAEKSTLLKWQIDRKTANRPTKSSTPKILFPSSTVGRKGCYELREAIAGLDVKLLTLGPDIEGSEFWNGFDVERITPDHIDTADLVVLPAFVEHRPRRVLQAVATGIPVIASTECGLSGVDGVETVESGDAVALRDAVVRSLAACHAKTSAPSSN